MNAGPETFTVAVLPTAAGTVTASTSLSGDLSGSDSTTTTITGNTFDFSGFFAPVDNPPRVNAKNAGSSVPLKFSLHGDQGLNILAANSPASQQVNCTTGAPTGPLEPTTATTALTYDSSTDRYTYTWKTDSTWAGTCRHLPPPAFATHRRQRPHRLLQLPLTPTPPATVGARPPSRAPAAAIRTFGPIGQALGQRTYLRDDRVELDDDTVPVTGDVHAADHRRVIAGRAVVEAQAAALVPAQPSPQLLARSIWATLHGLAVLSLRQPHQRFGMDEAPEDLAGSTLSAMFGL
ncbi:PxKF domain-containing protein [Streptomyces sp. HUAS TT7]|uniref:PxKF domain-containing protein n=1 Tax=Streptomyces sp. HUAS TT7 TaxID=3447507 RepID=UPI003F660BC9